MMKPVVEGRLLQALNLEAGEDVLEIGTGSGFLTACLAQLAREVVSIDVHGDFIDSARQRLLGRNHQHPPGNGRCDAVAAGSAIRCDRRDRRRRDDSGTFLQWLRPAAECSSSTASRPRRKLRVSRRGETLHSESLFETDIPYLHGAEPGRASPSDPGIHGHPSSSPRPRLPWPASPPRPTPPT